MSFSFKQLFKKDEQSSGVERTRLQFGQPQAEALPSTERTPPAEDSDGLSAEGVFTAPSSRIAEELPPSKSLDLPEVKSPFQIAESASGNHEFSGEAFPEPVSSSDPASSPEKEFVQGEGEVVKEAVTGLFNSVPPCADLSAPAGFYESVMETDADTPGVNPDPLSPGLCSSDESSVMEGGLPAVQRDLATSTIPGDSEAASSVTEPSWVADSEATQSVPSPFRVDAFDVSTAEHTVPVRELAGEITPPFTGEESFQSGEAPFPVTGSMSNNLQAEDAGFTGSFGDDAASGQGAAFSSRVPDEPPGFLPRPTDVVRPPELGGQEHIPAFLEKPGSLQDEGAVNRNQVSGFPETGAAAFPENGEFSSGEQSDEGQFPGIDPAMPNIPEFSSPEHQGIQEPRPDSLEPEQLPVPTELSSMVDGEKELSVAGPWPFEDEFVQSKAHTKQPEPLESLSPLSSTLSGSPSSFDPVGASKVVQDEFPPIGDCNVGSSTGQATLRAFLMTDGDIDEDMVARHCAELEGIHQCVVYTADGRVKSSSMPNGTLEIDGTGILESVRTLASAFAAGSEGPVTLRSPEGLVSFFSCGDACLGVLHSEEALKSGVQERLWLITCALSA